MPYVFPKTWTTLSRPHQRAQLIDHLDEIARPARSQRWVNRDNDQEFCGIEEVFHFLFDDNEFGLSAVGASLFNGEEAAAIVEVMDALEAIHRSKLDADDRYFLAHPGWKKVEAAAAHAHAQLSMHGLAEWQ